MHAGGPSISTATILSVSFARPEEHKIHASLMHDSACRKIKYAYWHLCFESKQLARDEDRPSTFLNRLSLLISIFDVQIVQITSLRPTADLFCAHLRDALKLELQRGQMKAMKSFVKTCYSETLIPDNTPAGTEDSELVQTEDVAYLCGLGVKFKFPGDPKKYGERMHQVLESHQATGCVRRRSSSSGPHISEVSSFLQSWTYLINL